MFRSVKHTAIFPVPAGNLTLLVNLAGTIRRFGAKKRWSHLVAGFQCVNLKLPGRGLWGLRKRLNTLI